MTTRWDKIIICLICFVAVGLYCVFPYGFSGSQGEAVRIEVDGEEYATYSLLDIEGVKRVEIKSQYGHNVLEISSKGAKMVSASCSDKIDIKCGMIKKVGQMIICVPSRIVVRIIGKSNLNVDKVTY